jgi:hypothetical protein
MKKIIFPVLFMAGVISISAQNDNSAILESLEASQNVSQDVTPTATVKTSTRLFRTKDDLTSVILIIPSGSVVSVLGSDSTYLIVNYQENKGYIFTKHAVIDKVPNTFKELQSSQPVKEAQPVQSATDARYEALVSKYGEAMATRLYAGKIWKGMNSEMARDSWGTAQKVNRVINGNVINEEWIYRSTWLHFENNTLINWGPVKK